MRICSHSAEHLYLGCTSGGDSYRLEWERRHIRANISVLHQRDILSERGRCGMSSTDMSRLLFCLVLCGCLSLSAAGVDVVNTREHPVTFPLGLMMIGLAVLAVPFYYLKQSNIIACIIIGIVVGSFELDVEWHLSVNTGSAIIELGILFLLFMVGS